MSHGDHDDLSSASVLAELGRCGSAERQLTLLATTGSTNDDARAAAAAGAPHGAAVIADQQTAGRGRGAHAWHSPPGENIHLSIVLRPGLPARRVAPIALAVGVAVAGVLESVLGRGVGIKWPNDVFVDGKKLAGILVESQLRGDAVTSLVVGVGVNVHGAGFPPELADRATSLRLLGCADLDRSRIAARLIVAIEEAVAAFASANGLAPVRAELARRDVLYGSEVAVAGRRRIACGIDDEGRLLVRDDAGELEAITAGEVELVLSRTPRTHLQ